MNCRHWFQLVAANKPPNGISANELAEYLNTTIEKTLLRAKDKMRQEADRLNIKFEEVM